MRGMHEEGDGDLMRKELEVKGVIFGGSYSNERAVDMALSCWHGYFLLGVETAGSKGAMGLVYVHIFSLTVIWRLEECLSIGFNIYICFLFSASGGPLVNIPSSGWEIVECFSTIL